MHKYISRRKLIIGAMSTALTGCDRIETATWTEEVKLHDGSTIFLRRSASRHAGGGFPLSIRGPMIDFHMKYTPTNVSWIGDHNRWPCSFEIFGGIPHVVAIIKDKCISEAPPDFAAQFYRFESGRWVNISQKEFPTKIALLNLYINFWGRERNDDPKGIVKWDGKSIGDVDFYPDRPFTIEQYFNRHQLFCNAFDRK